jgi:DNA-binding LytR/AlgR family response regulator
MDGVKVGKYIRETLNNQIIQIAYISSKREYAMELFDYRPINFLIKPLNAEMIKKKVIDKYIALLEKDNYIFTYKKRSEFFKISLSDILYFHNRNRKVTIMTQNGSDEFYDSMEKIYNEVKRYKFLFIHKSIIVNYDYIAKINYTELVMTDGTVFPISQSRRQAVREKFLKIKKGEQ